MSRDYRNLRTYAEAGELVLAAYKITRSFPSEERFAMTMQVRRAAVSVPVNIAEGTTRTTTADCCRFLEVALGSARECACLFELACNLGFGNRDATTALSDRYDSLCRSLTAMINALRAVPKG